MSKGGATVSKKIICIKDMEFKYGREDQGNCRQNY